MKSEDNIKLAMEVFMEGKDTLHIKELINKASLSAEESANKYLAAETSSDADAYMKEFKRAKILHEGLVEIYEKRK